MYMVGQTVVSGGAIGSSLVSWRAREGNQQLSTLITGLHPLIDEHYQQPGIHGGRSKRVGLALSSA
jgi:hypothetical protein